MQPNPTHRSAVLNIPQADSCTKPGEVGALLRREGLYSSHLTAWRAARAQGELVGAPRKRGPKPKVVDENAKRIVELERENAKLRARAERAEFMVEMQKKMAALFEPHSARRASRSDSDRSTRGRNGGHPHRVSGAWGAARQLLRWVDDPVFGPPKPRSGGRALTPVERERVLDVLHEPRFVDLAIPQVHAALLDEGTYLCSARTMYRIADQVARAERDATSAPTRTWSSQSCSRRAPTSCGAGTSPSSLGRGSGPTTTSTSSSTSSVATSLAGWSPIVRPSCSRASSSRKRSASRTSGRASSRFMPTAARR